MPNRYLATLIILSAGTWQRVTVGVEYALVFKYVSVYQYYVANNNGHAFAVLNSSSQISANVVPCPDQYNNYRAVELTTCL